VKALVHLGSLGLDMITISGRQQCGPLAQYT
jgi:hypothetical protein